MSNELLKQILYEISDIKKLQTDMGKQQKQMAGHLVTMEERQGRMEGRLDSMEERQGRMEVRLDGVEEKQSRIEGRLDNMEERQGRMEEDIGEIKISVKRLEENQPKDIMAMLYTINDKIDHSLIDIEYLKEKTGRHDADIHRIKKLMES